jgi:hypothetical protein
MVNLNIPLILLGLPRKEEQVFIALHLLHKEVVKKEKYTVKEISRLCSMREGTLVDILNRLVEKNIIGKLVYEGVIGKKIKNNFNKVFLALLFDKTNPLESAVQRAGYCIDGLNEVFVLNTVAKSWVYSPKHEALRKVKNLNKFIEDDFLDYLQKSLEDNKRKKTSAEAVRWNARDAVEKFRAKYSSYYNTDYIVNPVDYKHMKKLLTDLTAGNLAEDQLYVFFDHAFTTSKQRDYALQVHGLKYYVNDYLAKN